MKAARIFRFFVVAAIAFAVPFTAGATLRKEGTWPAQEKKVSFDFDGKPSQGLQQLAKKAGWSLVVSKGVTAGEHDVHVDVDDQPADAVLDALFSDSNVVAYRNGSIVTIRPDTAPAPPPAAETAPAPPSLPVAPAPPVVPAVPAVPPVPTVRGEDRDVMGGNIEIHKGEIVHTVTVAGGSAKIDGTVTGDLVVMGGSAKIREGGRVVGNATVFGGSLKVEKGARIDGNVGVMGGSVKREEGAIIGGSIVDEEHKGNVKVRLQDGQVSSDATPSEDHEPSTLTERAHAFGRKVTNMALLFVLGSVLLALLTKRMETLRIETASRPMKSFAWGVVTALLGTIVGAIALLILCITVIGIPIAAVLVLAAVLAFYGAMAAVLTTFGGAVIGQRTQSPYAHLLLGCAAFLVLSSIPYVGGVVTFIVVMISLGILTTTKVGGLLDRRKPRSAVI
jgi:hypothetical protein